MTTTVERFFTTLYAGQSGVLELRTVPRHEPAAPEEYRLVASLRDFVPVRQGDLDIARVARFVARTAEERLAAYFGVALRTPDAARDRKGDAAHCQTLTALFVDADFKKLGEVETRRRLAAYPIAPSIVVNSGGGLHPYWLLTAPCDLQTTYETTRTLLRRLAFSVADIVDTAVSEPARVLRVPGSLNFKYDPPRLVAGESLCETASDPTDLALAVLPPPGQPVASGVPSRRPLHVPDTIAEGDRHATLRDLMRSLQARGVPLDGALATCQVENRTKCTPPLEPSVLDAYLRRVADLPDRRQFERPLPKFGAELAGALLDIGLSVDATLVAVKFVSPEFDPERL